MQLHSFLLVHLTFAKLYQQEGFYESLESGPVLHVNF